MKRNRIPFFVLLVLLSTQCLWAQDAPAPAQAAETPRLEKEALPAVAAKPATPPTTLPKKESTADSIPLTYVIGFVMLVWLGFIIYRLKLEYDCQKRAKDEEQ
ncbi:MAG: hypothetical protein HN370_08230 [Phycisphaerales bacterium]|jgi:hypothetical protein|nr:hypothetical protein [Phycisphaerales bacterium]